MFTYAQLSHPPCPPIASQPISRNVPYAQARVFNDRALREHRRSSASIPPLFREQGANQATPASFRLL